MNLIPSAMRGPSLEPPQRSRGFSMVWLRCLVALTLGGTAAAGELVAVVGSVQVVRGGVTQPAKVGARLEQGDELVSQDAGEVVVRFDDGSRLALRPGSRTALAQLPQQPAPDASTKVVRLIGGQLRYVSAPLAAPRNTRFETSTATVGIRGTDLELAVTAQPAVNEPPGTFVRVRAGAVVVQAVDGTQTEVAAGQIAYGGNPDPLTRAFGRPQRPGARLLGLPAAAVFSEGRLDDLLR